jgi:hypothetical protein
MGGRKGENCEVDVIVKDLGVMVENSIPKYS